MNDFSGRPSEKGTTKEFTLLAALLLGLTAGFVAAGDFAWHGRHPASQPFPRINATSDVDDILDEYPAYLRFVVEAGKGVNRNGAVKLHKTYLALRKKDPAGAARFLKGLRFELVQKLELMGLSESSVSTQSPTIRRWVGRFLPAWHREADEYLFRARSAVAKR